MFPSALNAGAKRSGATCHMAMPQSCYLAKGANRPSRTTNMLSSSNLKSSSIHIPAFPPIQKQVAHTLDHKGLWFQANHTLDHIWPRVWSVWNRKPLWSRVWSAW